MTCQNELDLEQKINLIKEKERGLSRRQIKDKFQVSLGAISNILKRKNEYLNDYETNQNKKACQRSPVGAKMWNSHTAYE
jgi:transposase